jgi:tricorn protease
MPHTTRRHLLALLLPVLLPLVPAPSDAQVDARLLRYPAVSRTHIAFVYAGDIWVVPRDGGVAQRLSSPSGEEMFPRFSPDGSRIVFTANYDGNDDLYVIPAMGGSPERLTYHPADDRVIEWHADGRILFASSRTSEKDRFNKLYRVGDRGGLPEELPLPFGEFGSISADGRTLAYTHHTGDFRTWKRYRGGFTTDIWLFDLESKTSKKLPGRNSTDTQPLWNGTTLYFLSDRGANQRMNLWTYDARTEQVRQVTDFADHDVRFPSIGPTDIVFENGGRLYLLPLAGGDSRAVDVRVVTDLASLKPRVAKVNNLIYSFGVAPTGMRGVFEARGDIFTLPAEHGAPRNITQTPGVAERYPAWSPDGRHVAYWSDRTGEYELTIRNADGSGTERTVTRLGPGFRYRLHWSPDARQIAFIDQAMRIQVVDVASGRVREIDRANAWSHGQLQGFTVSWSADSRWLAFSRDLVRGNRAVFLYDTRNAKLHQATSGFYAASEPVFDPEGRYLYMFVNRSFTPSYSAMDNTWVYANPTVIAAVPLRRDVPSPLPPRSDEEPVRDLAAAAPAASGSSSGSTGSGAAGAPAARAQNVEIDLDGFESRMVVLPPKPGNYGELGAVAGKVLYHRHPRTGTIFMDEKQPIVAWDLKERKEETIVEDATTFYITADGKKMLVQHQNRYGMIDIKPNQKLEKTLAIDAMEVQVDPRAEWRQMFADAWRLQRDYFYDPNLHGVNWNAMREQYGALLEQAVTREDVNFVLGELIAELNASHAYRGGGDLEQPLRRGVGLLGVDFAVENGAYRIRRIVEGAPWDADVRSPLRQPGVNVAEGDYILAVNGVPLSVDRDPWAPFQGLAGSVVSLTVNNRPTPEGARTVTVQTLSSEGRLRNLAWIEANRRKVLEATNGRVGYIYVPDTGVNGQTELVRQFYGQANMDGLIIDERFNSGGQIPDRFVELLNRPVTNFWGIRDGVDWQWPPVAHTGARVMLINEWSGSGGDAFPFYFKQAGLGPLIGTRTWGGLIGISGAPGLVDGGSVTVPTFGIYADGEWIIENYGVDPDIEVEADPARMWNGGDPQLERAIQEVMRGMSERPPVRPSRPPYPNRARPSTN